MGGGRVQAGKKGGEGDDFATMEGNKEVASTRAEKAGRRRKRIRANFGEGDTTHHGGYEGGGG